MSCVVVGTQTEVQKRSLRALMSAEGALEASAEPQVERGAEASGAATQL